MYIVCDGAVAAAVSVIFVLIYFLVLVLVFQIFSSFSFVLVFVIFFVLVLVFVNEFVIFSFFTIFVFVITLATVTVSLQFFEPSLGWLPSREYYLGGRNNKILKSYEEFAVNLTVALGASRERAESDMKQMIDFEIQLARVS